MTRAALAYVGNPLDAAAWRIAGALAFAPDPGDEAAALAQAARDADVVLLEAQCAARLPLAVIEAALARFVPLLAIVPDANAPPLPIDPPERVRRQLGLDSGPGEALTADR
jgi:hypothetical protein